MNMILYLGRIVYEFPMTTFCIGTVFSALLVLIPTLIASKIRTWKLYQKIGLYLTLFLVTIIAIITALIYINESIK